MMIDFILGGARSGKSKMAEQRALESQKQVVYVATAQIGDNEMASRIEHHKQTRPQHWHTIEEPINLAKIIKQQDKPNSLILVDCLTLWLSNLLLSDDDSLFEREKNAFLSQLECIQYSDIILVSNETGLGVVPMGELSRRFVDESGWLHQRLGQLANRVTLSVAGLPHILKS